MLSQCVLTRWAVSEDEGGCPRLAPAGSQLAPAALAPGLSPDGSYSYLHLGLLANLSNKAPWLVVFCILFVVAYCLVLCAMCYVLCAI
jgi:hypothetical protein